MTGTTTAGIHAFKGHPLSPRGAFPAPCPVAAPGQRLRATEFRRAAPQSTPRYTRQSEDCLFLNIWSGALNARQPVMLYMHGGACSNSTSTDPLNDGSHLAAKEVVVVTVNHRLNALGYLDLARIDPRRPYSGNNGQLDLVLALRWVRANIAAFGGDAGNTSVFDQSGGGARIATMMGMPAARAGSTARSARTDSR